MSDEFLKIAREEIQAELDELERIISECNNDEHLFVNSKTLEAHFHKIKGLAPMIGQEKIGEMAKISDIVLKHMISKGILANSYSFMVKTIRDMKQVFDGLDTYDISDFKKLARDKFSSVPDLGDSFCT